MNWKTKSLLQRILSRAPGGKAFYRFGQTYVLRHSTSGGLKNFRVESRLYNSISMLQCLTKNNVRIQGACAVEFGTGWTPIIPLSFWLCGQKKCDTYDVSKLIQPPLVVNAAKQLLTILNHSNNLDSRLETWRTEMVDKSRQKLLQKLVDEKASAYEILDSCNIHYHAPVDAAKSGLPDKSIDLVYSHSVLGHVPENALYRLCKEAYRIIRPGAYTMHLIDLSDQFSQVDSSITKINFLQFSDEEYSKYNTTFCFQNRLRSPTYRQIIEDQGFQIILWKTRIDEKSLQQLPHLKLHKDFTNISEESLCTTSVLLLDKRL